MSRLILIFAFLAPIMPATQAAAISFSTAMESVNTSGVYMFYLHGAIVEQQGKEATSPQYGQFQYDRIIEHFEDRDIIVIEEVRGTTSQAKYASRIVSQVRQLHMAGVPSKNITVAGFSKGGQIALLVASSLGDTNVNYVIMAGCGRGRNSFAYQRFLKFKRGARLKGRILSIYASSDLEAGTCKDCFAQSDGTGIAINELRVKSGKGHGLFFQPRPEWINPVATFVRGE
jgi:hypothetical protein